MTSCAMDVPRMAGRGDAAKLDVRTGAPRSGGSNSTSMCRVEVEPVRVRMRTLLGSIAGEPGSSELVGVAGGEVGVAIEEGSSRGGAVLSSMDCGVSEGG